MGKAFIRPDLRLPSCSKAVGLAGTKFFHGGESFLAVRMGSLEASFRLVPRGELARPGVLTEASPLLVATRLEPS